MNVTVVIPHCHESKLQLERAVNSAYTADDIVIVDDGGTWLELHSHYRGSAKITVLCAYPGTNAGVCYARNHAINCIPDSLIIPLDADDYFTLNGIELLRDAWQPGTFVYGGWITDNPNGTFIIPSPPYPDQLHKKNLCQATMCFSKDDWSRVGGYNPVFEIGAEDYAFQCALVSAGITPVRIDQPVYHYTVNENGRAARTRKYAPFIKQLLQDTYPTVFTMPENVL